MREISQQNSGLCHLCNSNQMKFYTICQNLNKFNTSSSTAFKCLQTQCSDSAHFFHLQHLAQGLAHSKQQIFAIYSTSMTQVFLFRLAEPNKLSLSLNLFQFSHFFFMTNNNHFLFVCLKLVPLAYFPWLKSFQWTIDHSKASTTLYFLLEFRCLSESSSVECFRKLHLYQFHFYS